MKLKAVLFGALLTLQGSLSANAEVTLYPNPGFNNPITYNFTALGTGPVIAYFYASAAGYDETIGLLINGVSTGITGLPNHGSVQGQALNLGFANAGDTLTFVLNVSTSGDVFYSNPALNVSDGLNHVYSMPFSGSGTIPAGTFVAFEDLKFGGDKDFNDTSFVFTSGVPESSTWAMMLLGFAALGFVAYRRARRDNKAVIAG